MVLYTNRSLWPQESHNLEQNTPQHQTYTLTVWWQIPLNCSYQQLRQERVWQLQLQDKKDKAPNVSRHSPGYQIWQRRCRGNKGRATPFLRCQVLSEAGGEPGPLAGTYPDDSSGIICWLQGYRAETRKETHEGNKRGGWRKNLGHRNKVSASLFKNCLKL